MEDPLTDSEGNSYEKEAILDYIKTKSTSPVTHNALIESDLYENAELKAQIDLIRHQVTDENRFRNVAVSNAQQMEVEEEQKNQVEVPQVNNVDPSKMRLEISNIGDQVKVSVITPAGNKPSSCDIVCVIDVSGSMNDEASIKNESGDVEQFGLSILDLVKHSVRMIINNLGEHDRLSLVQFDTNAKKITDLLLMTAENKATTLAKLESLVPLDCTNIWDGLHTALRVIQDGQNGSPDRAAFSQVLLFTDGRPNVQPPRGHVPMMKKFKEENPEVNCSISTFGFGYNLDSQLLDEIAIEGGGSFAFIPDASFVGTIFVNAFSNLRTTLAIDAVLCLENENGTSFANPSDENELEKAKSTFQHSQFANNIVSWGMNVNVGQIQFGQSKDIIVSMKGVENAIKNGQRFLTATLKFKTSSTDKNVQEISASNPVNPEQSAATTSSFMQNMWRLQAVQVIRQAAALANDKRFEDAQKEVRRFINSVETHANFKSNPIAAVKDLLEDLRGQVVEAVSTTQQFTRWGKHYLRSLSSAHMIQQCNNFKDPGVQHFGGDLFKKQRDAADDAFLKMPAPKPSRNIKVVVPKAATSAASSSSLMAGMPAQKNQAASRPVTMARFHNNRGSCFAGECLATMADGSSKRVENIARGDLVMAGLGTAARVVCVVKGSCEENLNNLVELKGGLLITPYHPVRVNGEWKFPCDIAEPAVRECAYVYSFVLELGHTMQINGVECVTLAHNFQEDVVKHAYFGTEAVINDLSNMRGWNDGLVRLAHDCLIRDPVTTLVVGLKQEEGEELSMRRQSAFNSESSNACPIEQMLI